MIGTYGNIIFETSSDKILTPTNINRSSGSNWAKHDLISWKPRKQYVGSKLREFSCNITLRADLGVKPREMLEELLVLSEGSTAEYLIIGGKPVSELPLNLIDVSEAWGTMYNGGELLSASVTLTFEEYN